MRRKSYKDARFEELIPVIYARNMTEAEFYRSLLEDQEIRVVIDRDKKSEKTSGLKEGIAVLVSEEDLSEAQDILERRNETDDEMEVEYEKDSIGIVEALDDDV
jgi:hypothetical protein